MPVTLAHGYLGDPSRPADYSAWLLADSWSIDETAALLVGVQPNWHEIPLRRGPHAQKQHEYRQILSYLQRSVKAGKLKEPITPLSAVAWAKKKGFLIPAQLEIQAPEHRDLGAKERQTLLKLLLGMANEKYRYDSKDKTSTAYQLIANDLQKHGLRVDVDTVRKWLKIAAVETDKN